MEFRFRASEEREPSWFADPPPRRRLPPLPSPLMGPSGFFHDQAMQGYIGLNGPMRTRPPLELELEQLQRELPVRPEPALEDLERELHKERIKEEILARRISQRRMLEQQAWHDMKMERRVVMERFQFERFRGPSLIMPHDDRFGLHIDRRNDVLDQETLRVSPHLTGRQDVDIELDQQLPLRESSKIELVTETKSPPTARVSGTKRKIAAKISGATGPKFQKPLQKDWSCALCQVSMTNEESLDEHLRGKKHLAKAASELIPRKNSRGPSDETQSSSTSASTPAAQHKKPGHREGGKKVQIQVDGRMHDVLEKGTYLWCMLCKAKCNSKSVMAGHIRGKRHSSEVSKMKKAGEEQVTADAEEL